MKNRFVYTLTGLLIAGTLISPLASAVVDLVGDQSPDRNYHPLIKKSASEAYPSSLQASGPRALQRQFLVSAGQVHKVQVLGDNGFPKMLTAGLLPRQVGRSSGAVRTAKPVNPTAEKPAVTSDASVNSAVPAASSLPPDPNFSFLSLLQPNLAFVQKIQGNLATAAALAALAAGLSATLGFAFLSSRSKLLQTTFQEAWYWMMAEGVTASLPSALKYTTTQGHSFDFYDTFAKTATGKAFTAADLVTLKQYLDILPQDSLQYVQFIVNGPVPEMLPGFGVAATMGTQISIEGASAMSREVLAHEIGATLYGGLRGAFTDQWDSLWSRTTNPPWDTVECYSTFPRPIDPNRTPWGYTNEVEDFITIFSDWAGSSGTPRLLANQSSSVLEEAIYRAAQGHPILLEKTLLVAALFTDASTQQLSLYTHKNYHWPDTIQKSPASTVQASATSLKLGDYTFTIVNGLLTSVSSPATALQAALHYTFTTPVPIPAFAAARWGLK